MNCRFITITSILSFWCIQCLAASESSRKESTIVVSMHELPPFVVVQKSEVTGGFVYDIFKRMAEKVGHSGAVNLTSFRRGLSTLQVNAKLEQLSSRGKKLSNRAHLIIVRTPMREAQFKWVGPLVYDGTVFYQRADDKRLFTSLTDIKHQNALCTIQRKVMETEIFDANDIPYYATDSQEQAIALLSKAKKRFDCTPIAIMNTEQMLQQAGISLAQLKPMSFQLPAHPVYMAFSRSTPDEVVAKWQAALDELGESGQRLEIIQSYIPIYTESLEQKLKSNITTEN